MSHHRHAVEATSLLAAILLAFVVAAACAQSGSEPGAASQADRGEAPAQSEAPASADAVKKGRLAFNNNCRTCHSVKKGDNRLGPSLHGVIGRKAGAAPGYAAYSQGVRNSGIVWDEETLDRFIENPDAVIPNNNMNPYAGIPDPAVREQIIAYLKSESGKGA
jgi:cytochrome c